MSEDKTPAELFIEDVMDYAYHRALDSAVLVDAFQVMATYITENGDTAHVKSGFGNWYARLGMAKEFVDTNNARVNHQVKKDEYSD